MLKEGDVIRIESGHTVYAMIPAHFAYANRRGDFSLVRHEATIGEEFDYLAGLYVVVKTCLDGGSDADGYPDGFHVFCEKADNPEIKIDFYQTGDFTAMIKDINAIGRARLQWVCDIVD